MDAQVLAATLATLATVFAGLNGGAFTVEDIKNTEIPESNQKSNSIIPKIPLLDKITQKPEPKNQIKAEITLPEKTTLPFKNAEIKLNQNTLNNSKTTIKSPSSIKILNSTGKITFSNNTRIKADSKQIRTNKVQIKQETPINNEITDIIQIKNTDKISLKYENASIKPARNSEFGINSENSNLKINSFKGNISINPETKKIIIEGKVDKLNAGQYQLNN